MLGALGILVQREQSVAQIVLDHPRCARIFVERGIDFCCRGGMSLAEACSQRGIEEDTVLAELEAAAAGEAPPSGRNDPRTLSNLQLVAHVVDQHHLYLRKTLPLLELLAGRVADAHAQRRPSLTTLHTAIHNLRVMLERHLDEEETVVFPLLVSGEVGSERARRELASMQEDHLEVGDVLRELRLLTDGFLPPPWACNTYRALMAELEALERDTFEHVHLENNVLAPRFGASPGDG